MDTRRRRFKLLRPSIVLLGALNGLSACGGTSVVQSSGTAACTPPGPPPVFTLVSPESGKSATAANGTIVVSTAASNPAFTGSIVLSSGASRVPGGILSSAFANSGTPALSYYQGTYAGLTSGLTYDVELAITQYTNLAVRCQKQFTVSVGSVVAQ